MKKVYLFIGLMLSALAIGCQGSGDVDQNQPVQGGNKKVVVTVNATLPSNLVWAAGDKVAINGLESTAVTEEGAGSATYAFVSAQTSAPVVVVSPYEIMTGLGEVTLPATQDYVADGFDRAVYGMAGIAPELTAVDGDEKNLAADVNLLPVMGVVSLPLTLDSATAENPISIKQVSFTANGGAAINGVWNAEAVTVTDEAGVVSYDVKMTVANGSASTNLDCGEGVAIDTVAPVYFNLVVPAATYTGGFEVVLTDAADHNFVLNLTEDVVVERGAVVELTPSVFTVIEKAPATLSVTIAQPGIVWQEGDAIVCNNSLSTNTVAATAVGTQSAEFAFEAVAYPYSVFYPAEYYTTSGSLRFYETQSLIKDGYDRKNLVMVGYSNTTEVVLNNLCGIVTIPVTNKYEGETIIIDKVEVATSEGDAIAGKYHINYRTNALTVVSGKSSIVLEPEVEDSFTIEPEATVNISFVVPRGVIRNGLVLNIYSSVGILENHKVFPTGVTVRGGETATADVYEYKEVKIDAIRTAEELIDFAKCVNMGRYKKYVNEAGKVVLGNDIDMAAVTPDLWIPIVGPVDAETGANVGFDGIFDGCGFAIKNWTTTRGLFAINKGTVENLIIDENCVYTSVYNTEGDKNVGFVVESNSSSGVVSNCVNNGSVIVNDLQCAGHRIAGVVGTSYGTVRNCTNNGSVDVTSPAVNNNQNIGGVVGYANPNAGGVEALHTEFVVGCTNTGNVTVVFHCLPKKSCVGGVVGGTQMGASTSAAHLGTIKNCINKGNVKYRFETLSSGTYSNIGGVVGYAQADIVGCENFGRVESSTPTDPAYAGTRAAAGGVVGCTLFAVQDCTNNGELFIEGVWAAGTNDAAGSGAQAGSSFGGVAGCVGVYNQSKAEYPAKNCINNGEINMTVYCKTGGGTAGYFGGVIGYTINSVSDCHNHAKTNIKTFLANTYIAGVVGYAQNSSVSNATNNAETNIEVMGMTTADKECWLGGVVGRASYISSCQNNAATTMIARPCSIAIKTLYTGAIAGYCDVEIKDCTLNAPYGLTTDSNGASLRCAGIVGQVKTISSTVSTVINCHTTDKASVSLVTSNKKANYVGGIIASCNNGLEECTNRAPVSVTFTELNTSGSKTYISGIAGLQKQNLKNCHNYADITADLYNSSSPLYAGSIVGHNNGASAKVISSTNSGNITISNTEATDLQVGALVGLHGSETDIADDCSSTGVVTVNGAAL